MKRWEKRRYFTTRWEPGPPIDHLGPIKIEVTLNLPACTIYGYEDDSPDDRDHAAINGAMRRGLIFGRWFSTQCVDGEWGSHRMNDLTKITQEEFEALQKNGFKSDG